MAVSMSTLNTSAAHAPARVWVTSSGPVGNLAAQIFTRCGYRVTGIDPVESRRNIAKACGLKDIRASVRDDSADLERKIALHLECSRYEQAGYSLNFKSTIAGRVDGIVLIHRSPMEVAAALRKNLPVVSIVHEYPGADVDIISLDDRGGMDMIISHLLSAGYKRIGFFGLCPEMTWSRSRFGAFAEAMVRHGCANRLGDIVEVTLAEALAETAFSESASLTKAKKLTNSGVDAWVGASEATSLSLYFALKTAGVKIPSAVGITSFDSKLSAGNSCRPNFTSTQAASSELGASALRRIVHRIEGSDTFRRIILLPCSLHVGNTTRDSR